MILFKYRWLINNKLNNKTNKLGWSFMNGGTKYNVKINIINRTKFKKEVLEIENLYDEKMKEVSSFLSKVYSDENIWNMECAIQEKDEFFCNIRKKLYKKKNLKCSQNLINDLCNIVTKYKNVFEILDEESEDDELKYEQYFDTLCEMPINVYEYIDNILKKYSKNNSYSIQKSSFEQQLNQIYYDSDIKKYEEVETSIEIQKINNKNFALAA